MISSAEYFARYNLGNEVEFEPYTNGIVSYTDISNASRGSTRPTWELLYSHYVQLKGLDAPWTTAYLNYSLTEFGGFEPGAGTSGSTSGAFDGLGWGSLLYHRDNNDTAPASTTSSLITTSTSSLISLSSSAPVSPGASSTSSSIQNSIAGASSSYAASSTAGGVSSSTTTRTDNLPTVSGTSTYSTRPSAHAHSHGCNGRPYQS